MKRHYLPFTLLIFLSLACGLPSALIAATPAAEPSAALPTADAVSTPAPPTPAPTSLAFDASKLGATDRDITYCTMDGVELKMDIYYPQTAEARWPVTMYVHGGGWSSGEKNAGAGALEIPALQSAGFLVVAVNYRLAPQYQFPAMIEDVKCAVRYLRAHADQYNLDPDHIGAWGGSAGGHLVNLLGTTDASAGFDVGEYLEYSSRVQAVVDMFGPADLTVPFEGGYESASRVFDGFDAALASPVTYVTPDDPPFLLLHGDSDKLVPIEQSQELLAALQAAGVPAELVTVKNAGHSFKPAGSGPISPSRRQITQLVVEFFTRNLR